VTQPQITGTPYLVVLTPGSTQGRRFDLTAASLLVGRASSCDVCLDAMDVSRIHAALRREGNDVVIEDVASSGGTFVNDEPVLQPRKLRIGDVVALASVRMRYDVAASQHGDIEQYNDYVQSVLEQRENLLRDIASTRTKARWLVWLGLLGFVVGFGLFAAVVVGFIAQMVNSFVSEAASRPEDVFGRDIAGVPAGLVGWIVAAVGVLLLIIGIVLHGVADSRRKRIDRDLPMPRPWPGAGQPGT
jgi:FHA domain